MRRPRSNSHSAPRYAAMLHAAAMQARAQAQQLDALAAELVLSHSDQITLIMQAVPYIRGELYGQRVNDFDNGVEGESTYVKDLRDWLDRADQAAKDWNKAVADLNRVSGMVPDGSKESR